MLDLIYLRSYYIRLSHRLLRSHHRTLFEWYGSPRMLFHGHLSPRLICRIWTIIRTSLLETSTVAARQALSYRPLSSRGDHKLTVLSALYVSFIPDIQLVSLTVVRLSTLALP